MHYIDVNTTTHMQVELFNVEHASSKHKKTPNALSLFEKHNTSQKTQTSQKCKNKILTTKRCDDDDSYDNESYDTYSSVNDS